MAEEDDDYREAVCEEVLQAYREEDEYIAAYIDRFNENTSTWIPSALGWIPWIGSVFDEEETGTQAILSGINRRDRAQRIIKKVEDTLGPLDEETKKEIQEDVGQMYDLK